jgi:nucleoside-diphosphate-sugar epimerase
MNILLTGATGFVGRSVLAALLEAGHDVRVAGRRRPAACETFYPVGDIGPDTDWREALDGIDTVVHLAGHAHDADPDAHHGVNYLGTRRLAEAAAGQCRRFVFISSLAVHGLVASNEPVSHQTPVNPDTPYGTAKANAEEAVDTMAAKQGMEALILRPAVIYGPHAPGNIGRLMSAVQRGLPLPLAGIDNRRSLLGRDHLARAIALAAGQDGTGIYPLADDHPVSTPALLRALADGAGRPARLLPCPVSLLRMGAVMLGRGRMADQLAGSLEVDSQAFRSTFGAFCENDSLTGLADAMRQTINKDKGAA